MKKLIPIIVVLVAIPAFAVPGWLIGFSVGVGVQVVPWTRNHIILPPLRTVQHTIRPIPQDKIDREMRRSAKREAKRYKAQQKLERQHGH